MIDVDGTLAEYSKWESGKPIGEPISLAVETVNRLHEHFKIILFTTRSKKEVEVWANMHGVLYDLYRRKPLCYMIIDDRRVRFNGDWSQTLKDIGMFKPWNNAPT